MSDIFRPGHHRSDDGYCHLELLLSPSCLHCLLLWTAGRQSRYFGAVMLAIRSKLN